MDREFEAAAHVPYGLKTLRPIPGIFLPVQVLDRMHEPSRTRICAAPLGHRSSSGPSGHLDGVVLRPHLCGRGSGSGFAFEGRLLRTRALAIFLPLRFDLVGVERPHSVFDAIRSRRPGSAWLDPASVLYRRGYGSQCEGGAEWPILCRIWGGVRWNAHRARIAVCPRQASA